jgi:hypothetical protein
MMKRMETIFGLVPIFVNHVENANIMKNAIGWIMKFQRTCEDFFISLIIKSYLSQIALNKAGVEYGRF